MPHICPYDHDHMIYAIYVLNVRLWDACVSSIVFGVSYHRLVICPDTDFTPHRSPVVHGSREKMYT
ncbi:hypothetical protein BD310DRAFT_399621 [Dichomitus squalens]|uniref:Uncharacterized protein n=1 Tax=Dichomitus squalens TaxID=114155 RepID=A0A4Q9QCP8_9APHY|nr:hypothetical protein BD310DRAFT_399621 [Dichomitus squalens]